MIRIKHFDLDYIRKLYCDNIVSEIRERIQYINDVKDMLHSSNAINAQTIKGKFHQFNKALTVITRNKGADKTEELVMALNNTRASLSSYKLRIDKILHDIDKLNKNNLLPSLISSEPKKLQSIQTKALSVLKLDKKDNFFQYLFSYNDFYDSYIKKIGYDLGINVCPYCNRQFITTVQDLNGERIIGPTYDHFFSQTDNPLLTVSFYNLIPSCYTCNSNLKSKVKFEWDKHLHPYFHDIEEAVSFDFDLHVETTDDISKIEFKPTINPSKKLPKKLLSRLLQTATEKGTGSLDVFRISDIYATHTDVVKDIREKFNENSVYYVDSIKAYLQSLQTDEGEFYRFHFSNYYNAIDFNKRPLSKLTKDIYNKMKEIYKIEKLYKAK